MIGVCLGYELKSQHLIWNCRIDRLERAVNTLLNRFGEIPIAQSSVRSNTPDTSNVIHRVELHEAPANNNIVAPIYVLRDLVADAGAQSPEEVRTRHEISYGARGGDVINEGLLSMSEASMLMAMWVCRYKLVLNHPLIHPSVFKSIMADGSKSTLSAQLMPCLLPSADLLCFYVHAV